MAVINGGYDPDTLNGGGGNDVLRGKANHDVLYGGGGADSLYGGTGNDSLYGQAGADSLDGGTGNDLLDGGTGNDLLFGEAGADTLYGGNGNDTIHAGTGADTLYGGTGKDMLIGEAGADTLYGGNGNDMLHGGNGADSLYGGGDNDRIYGGNNNDELDGGTGNDYIDGGSGYDIVYQGGSSAEYSVRVLDNNSIELRDTAPNTNGDFGRDTLVGVERIFFKLKAYDAYDVLTGGATADSLRNSGVEKTIMIGGGGNDTLWSGANNDILHGGTGHDIIDGDRGNDYIDGGVGYDVVNQGGSRTEYNIRIFDNNSIQLQHTVPDFNANMPSTGKKNFGTDTLVRVDRIKFYTGGVYDVVKGSIGNDKLSATQNWSIIIGWDGNDTLNGGTGNDHFRGGTGNDSINGGSGFDAVNQGGSHTEYNITILDNNSIKLRHTVTNNKNSGTDTLVGVERIYFDAGGAYDVVTGGAGNDTLSAGNAWSIIVGGGGNDLLNGKDNYFDTLHGGTGSDTLDGGRGKDILTGGTGADRFIFNSVADGLDTITDFNSAESDLIQISASGFGGITNTNDFSFNSANNTLSFKQDQIAILQGVTTFNVATSLVLA